MQTVASDANLSWQVCLDEGSLIDQYSDLQKQQSAFLVDEYLEDCAFIRAWNW